MLTISENSRSNEMDNSRRSRTLVGWFWRTLVVRVSDSGKLFLDILMSELCSNQLMLLRDRRDVKKV